MGAFMQALDKIANAPSWARFGTRRADINIIGSGRSLLSTFGFGSTRELTAQDLSSTYNDLVYAFLNFRASELSAHILNAEVQRISAQNEWDKVEPVHPWVRLMQRPSYNLSPIDLWYWAVQVYDMWGHSEFVIEDTTVAGIPVPGALHPMYPEFGTLRPDIGPNGSPKGYIYWRNDGKRIPLELTDVIRLRRPHPVDPRRTASLIEASAYQIDTEVAQTIYGRDQARDQGRPHVILETEAEMLEEDMNELSLSFAKRYDISRLPQIKGVPVLSGGLKATPIQLNPRDQQYVQTRMFTEARMFYIWGIHKGLFSENATEANAKAAIFTMARFKFQPDLKVLLSQLEFQFERAFRADPAALRIAAPNVIPIDQKEQAEIDKVHIESGQRTINEIRKRDGKNDVEGGDRPLVSGGLVPLDSVGLEL